MNVSLARTFKRQLLVDMGHDPDGALAAVHEQLRGGRLSGPAYHAMSVYLELAGRSIGVGVVSPDRYVQARYVAIRMDGGGHVLAEMLTLQLPPMSNTDREFLEGYCNGSQFEKTPSVGDFYAGEAREQGVDITGKVYMAPLASYPGDPTAWVSGRGDVVRVAEAKGMSVQGSVTVKARDLGPPPEDVTVADDLVQARVDDLVQARPELAERDPGELFHEVRETVKPHWGK